MKESFSDNKLRLSRITKLYYQVSYDSTFYRNNVKRNPLFDQTVASWLQSEQGSADAAAGFCLPDGLVPHTPIPVDLQRRLRALAMQSRRSIAVDGGYSTASILHELAENIRRRTRESPRFRIVSFNVCVTLELTPLQRDSQIEVCSVPGRVCSEYGTFEPLGSDDAIKRTFEPVELSLINLDELAVDFKFQCAEAGFQRKRMLLENAGIRSVIAPAKKLLVHDSFRPDSSKVSFSSLDDREIDIIITGDDINAPEHTGQRNRLVATAIQFGTCVAVAGVDLSDPLGNL